MTTNLNSLQNAISFTGLMHILQTPKSIYNGKYKEALTNATEGSLRLATITALGLGTLFLFRNNQQRPSMPCLSPSTDKANSEILRGFSYSSDAVGCSMSGKAGALCYKLGFKLDINNGSSILDCTSLILSKHEDSTENLLKIVTQDVNRLAKEIQDYCHFKFNNTAKEPAYDECIKSTLVNHKLLQSFMN